MLSPIGGGGTRECRNRRAKDAYVQRVLADPTVSADRKAFFHDLAAFYRRRWNVNLRVPAIAGVSVDLFQLYSRVAKLGGWLKVTSSSRWWEVAEALGIREELCGADHALKLIYMRYLNRYEKWKLFGDVGDEDPEESGGRSRNRGTSFLVNLATADCPYVRSRQELPDSIRTNLGLPAVQGPNHYRRIIRSLQSGLPNELDFALNILTLLSHPGPKLLHLAQAPQILPLLLAHIGIFAEGAESLQPLYDDGWRVEERLPFKAFWDAGLQDADTRALLAIGGAPVDDDDLFAGVAPGFDLTKPLPHRVLQIASILRNLSFENPNKLPMADSFPLIKFINVCISSSYVPLKSVAFDILSNVATEMVVSGPTEEEKRDLVLRSIGRGLESEDKLQIIRSLETLAGLCSSEENEETLTEFLTAPILRRVLSFVAVRDIMLAVYVLEALYQVSELGAVTADRIAHEPHAIDVLVDMATVEAVSFGPSGLAGMKVVEYGVPPSSQQPSTTFQAAGQTPRLIRPVGSMPPPPIPTAYAIRAVAAPSPKPLPQSPAPTATPARPLIQGTLLAAALPDSVEAKEGEAISQDQQAEDLTVTWLQTNLLIDPSASISRGEVYAAYVGEMHKVYMSLCVSASTFGALIKKNFPMVTIRRVEGGSRPNMMQVDGVRYVPRQIPIAASPAPLAKALAPPTQPSLVQQHPLVNSMLSSSSTPPPQRRTLPATVTGSKGPVRILVVRKPPPPVDDVSRDSFASTTASPDSLVSASVDDNSQSPKASVDNPQPNGGSSPAKMDALPPNCHLEVCEQAQEAKHIIDQGTKHEARIVRVENTAASGVSEAGAGNNSQPSHLLNGSSQPHAPKTLNGPVVVNGTNGVKPTLVVKSEEKSAAAKGQQATPPPAPSTSLPRTPSPDSMGRNLINCQANIAELLNREEKNGVHGNGNGSPGLGGPTTPLGRGRGRGGRGRGRSPVPGSPSTSRDSFASPSVSESREGLELPTTPSAAELPKPKKSHKKKKPHELIRNQKAAAALLAAQQKAAMEASAAAKRAAEMPAPMAPEAKRVAPPPQPSPAPPPTAAPPPAFRALTIPVPANIRFQCEWAGCSLTFERANLVYLHAAKDHVTPNTRACLWPHCDPAVPRHPWSLTTHLQDIHCSEGALRTAALRRYEMSLTGGESSIPPPRTPPPHPGYSRTAAFDAVRRHALNFLPKELTEETEGPVTKSIRLTSCLILRNLARYSAEGRRKLRKYEGGLSVLALSRLESSTTLAQTLAELSQPLSIQPPSSAL